MTPQPNIPCIACQGSGIGLELQVSALKPGRLLPLCNHCRGAGNLNPLPEQPYRAAWVVGSKYLVRMTVERRKGGFVELDLDWYPRLPPATGKGRLRPSERKDYEAGRDEALRQHMAEMGGGQFSVIAAGDRH